MGAELAVPACSSRVNPDGLWVQHAPFGVVVAGHYLREILALVEASPRSFHPCHAVCYYPALWGCVVNCIAEITCVRYNSFWGVIHGADPKKHKLPQLTHCALPEAEQREEITSAEQGLWDPVLLPMLLNRDLILMDVAAQLS